jgi:hypothetical protein
MMKSDGGSDSDSDSDSDSEGENENEARLKGDVGVLVTDSDTEK